ncbi:hypothetical protein [Rhizobium rhizoryzae]|uniref:Uncharacterized protein n=1 Tax=Rhizobium rhizoryzae TaxID=451876 RepID=A0A7W6LMP4_9HYPH|nr:hypothetical protein [Rhizobium rhizoryzae]MBB4145916.1 hypothetical protein [Rhizobium rhizoryzae]
MSQRSKIWFLSLVVSLGLWSVAIQGGIGAIRMIAGTQTDSLHTASTK